MNTPANSQPHVKAEGAFMESEERFRLLVEGVKDYAIFMLDLEGRVVSWNLGAERIKGYKADEVIGKHFSIFYTEGDVERGHPEEELRIAKAEGRYEEQGLRVRKDGSTFWANVLITALWDEEGNLRGFAKVTRDITQWKRSEDVLRQSEERFRLLVKGVKDYAIFMLDLEGRVVSWNAGAERIKGYNADEILGEHFSIFYPEEDVKRGKPRLELEMVKAEGTYEEEGLRVRKDGSTFWANVLITALWGEEGNLRGFAKVTRDITERKEAEEALRRREERFRLLVQSSSDIMTVFDAVGPVIYQSHSIERVLGYKPEDRIGKNVFVSLLVHPEDLASKRAFFAEARRSLGTTVRAKFRLRHADGSWRHIEAVGTNRLQEPSIRGIVATYRDVTERKRAEGALREAQEAERRRIARDLHDVVLQELSIAKQWSEIARSALHEEQTRASGLEEITNAIQGAIRGVREAISGLHPEGTEGAPFVRSLEALLETHRQMDPGLETELSLEEGFPSELPNELGRELLRALQEALTNVRRHSGAHRTQVTLRAEGDRIEAEVSDDGRGFEVGTTSGGLGLTSMHERTVAFGGSLEVQSEPGKGTQILFRIPRPPYSGDQND